MIVLWTNLSKAKPFILRYNRTRTTSADRKPLEQTKMINKGMSAIVVRK
jgi:hypothetical protein